MKKIFKNIFIFISFLALLILAPITTMGQDIGGYLKDYVEYSVPTNKIFTVAWSACGTADYYEVRLYDRDRKIYIDLGSTTDTQFTFQLPKSKNHYVMQVRATNIVGSSDWSESIDPVHATVNGQSKGWCIYGELANPGTPIIE